MARLTSPPPFIGTRHNICIYQMYGQYYMRSASSLNGDRVKHDPRFRKTMQFANLLKRASGIASAVYQTLPLYNRQHALYRKLTGEAMQWLKHQWKEEDIIAWLQQQYGMASVKITATPATQLRPTYRRKSAMPVRNKKRKLTVSPVEENALPLRSWRLHNKWFRQKYNKTIEYYPWATHVMNE